MSSFRQADVERAIKAARKAGLVIFRVEIEIDRDSRRIAIVHGEPTKAPVPGDDSAVEEWLRKESAHRS
jgi:hypothetical protein